MSLSRLESLVLFCLFRAILLLTLMLKLKLLLKNVEILVAVGKAAKTLGIPVRIGTDWQMVPDVTCFFEDFGLDSCQAPIRVGHLCFE